jgi:hypothetical protein
MAKKNCCKGGKFIVVIRFDKEQKNDIEYINYVKMSLMDIMDYTPLQAEQIIQLATQRHEYIIFTGQEEDAIDIHSELKNSNITSSIEKI